MFSFGIYKSSNIGNSPSRSQIRVLHNGVMLICSTIFFFSGIFGVYKGRCHKRRVKTFLLLVLTGSPSVPWCLFDPLKR